MKIKGILKSVGISFVLAVCSSSVHAIDKCLIGNWKADSAELQKFFTKSSAQVFSNPSGNVLMNLNSNGTGQYRMNSLKLVSVSKNAADPKVTMTMNGLYSFNWQAANNTISLNQHNNNIKTTGWVEASGMKIALPPINHNQFSAKGLSSGAYNCSGNKLTFKMQGAEKMLTIWHKQ